MEPAARMPELQKFATAQPKICTIADLVAYRMRKESLVRLATEALLPTRYGDFKAIAFEMTWTSLSILPWSRVTLWDAPILVRFIRRSDRRRVRQLSVRLWRPVATHNENDRRGRQGRYPLHASEGRGIGLTNKLRAYALQDEGKDTVEANLELGSRPTCATMASERRYWSILSEKIRLITNNPKMVGLEGYGIDIVERVPVEIEPTVCNLKYLQTKREKLGHLLENL
jgi:3,4-dihydroxy 2-butanone 4-phosphate synthase/GTP cyclohydrolase II